MQIPPAASFDSFDWFLVLMLVLSTIMAFLRGFIRTLFSFCGFIFGLVLASWNHLTLAHHLHRWIASFVAAEIVAFLAILALVVMLFHLLAAIVRRTVAAIGLGFIDRILGAAFGFFRGCVFGVAAMIALAAFAPDSTWVVHSQLAPYFLDGAHAVSFVVPERFQRQISLGAAHLLQQSPKVLKPHPLRPTNE
jgi:membrane protein required for colicin V production